MLTFLGGHKWHTKEIHNRSNVLESSLSFGTYAFAVPRRNVRHLLLSAEDDLVNGFRDESNVHLHSNFLSPEKSWYRLAHTLDLKIHVTQPLFLWHEEGYSNTWKTKRHAIVGRKNQIETEDEIIVTGAPANCTLDSTDERSEMDQSETLLSKERVTVSCRSLAYKLPVKQLREVKTIPIIVGVLSHAKNVQRRQVSGISDFSVDLSKSNICFLNNCVSSNHTAIHTMISLRLFVKRGQRIDRGYSLLLLATGKTFQKSTTHLMISCGLA